MPNNPTLYELVNIRLLKEGYQDVIKNKINILGKVWVIIEYNNTQKNLPLLITNRTDITTLVGMNWQKQLPIIINRISVDEETNQSEKGIHTKFKKLFETNHAIENNGELKPVAFASRYLNDAEKKFSVGELELLAVGWGLKRFRFDLY